MASYLVLGWRHPSDLRVLSNLVAITEAEKDLYLASGASIEDCIASAEYWAISREQIWGALDASEIS
jgi:hypothetical protein